MIKILEIKPNKNLRCLTITMLREQRNDNLLTGEELFKAIYNTIMNNSEFKSFG